MTLGCAGTVNRGITHISVLGDEESAAYFYVAYGEGPGREIKFSRLLRCTVNPNNTVTCVPEPEVDQALDPNAPPAPQPTQAAPPPPAQPVPVQTAPAPLAPTPAGSGPVAPPAPAPPAETTPPAPAPPAETTPPEPAPPAPAPPQ